MNSTRWTRAWRLSAGVALVMVVVTAGVGAAWSQRPIAVGETVPVDLVFRDAATGRPIYASSEILAGRLEPSTGSSTLFSPHRPPFVDSISVVAGKPQHGISILVANLLPGLRPGSIHESPVFPSGWGTWEGRVTLARDRGVFPMEVDFPRAEFVAAYGPPEVGAVFRDERLTDASMQVMRVDADLVRYRNILDDGQSVLFPKLGWTATAQVDELRDTFRLVLDVPSAQPTKYACGDPVFPELTPGNTYRLAGATTTHLELQNSSAPFPDLVARPLYIEVHVKAPDRLANLSSRVTGLFD